MGNRLFQDASSEGAMAYRTASSDYRARILFGFIAGFLATLSFHQLSVWVLWIVGLAPFAPFSMALTKPFGIPAVISLAAWGGIWGILFALIDRKFPAGGGYWVVAFLFGAIFPSLVALLMVLPLKGRPLGGGWRPPLLLTVFLINGAWGAGTGLILRVLSGCCRR
jgi:apolipoprotein N-acyltransferase